MSDGVGELTLSARRPRRVDEDLLRLRGRRAADVAVHGRGATQRLLSGRGRQLVDGGGRRHSHCAAAMHVHSAAKSQN